MSEPAMSEPARGGVDNAQIMHSIGQLTGAVQAMQQGLTARIDDIRQDIRRLDQANNERMDRIEDGLGRKIDDQGKAINQRIDGISSRVTSLEVEDKRMIEKVSKLSALGGGVGGALAAGIVELLKRL